MFASFHSKGTIDNQQYVMVSKGESLVGHRVAQIKFDPFLDLLNFSL